MGIPNAHAEHSAQDFNIELNERIQSDEALRPAYTYLRIFRQPGRHANGAMLPETREPLMQCILDYLRSGEYKQWATDEPTYRHDWPGSAFGYHLWVGRVPSPLGYVEFDDQRGSFNPDAMVQPDYTALKESARRPQRMTDRCHYGSFSV